MASMPGTCWIRMAPPRRRRGSVDWQISAGFLASEGAGTLRSDMPCPNTPSPLPVGEQVGIAFLENNRPPWAAYLSFPSYYHSWAQLALSLCQKGSGPKIIWLPWALWCCDALSLPFCEITSDLQRARMSQHALIGTQWSQGLEETQG